MILRDDLEKYLMDFYKTETFEDYCTNGLVVEGKKEIGKIALGVSFNSLFLDEAMKYGCDSLIVHHGIFGRGPFMIRGYLRSRLKKLFENNISLFSIHLPMDAHPEIGHNALLFKAIGAAILEPYKWGFIGVNTSGYSLKNICEKFSNYLVSDGSETGFGIREYPESNQKNPDEFRGFLVLDNGPDIPERMLIASGGSTDLYEESLAKGIDTFICGEIKEHIPSISLETNTNFINLGHYYSEKPGIIALKEKIEKDLAVECKYIDVVNPV